MSRSLSLEKIPSVIRKELIARSEDRPGLTLNDHVDWLSEQGYKVSRSAVHRYLAELKDASATIPSEATDQLSTDCSIRLGCLMVAANYSLPGDKVDLLNTATELAAWVKASATD
ncbi:TPA: helix-turn-helix domain-containing protein [Pseudomonas aeruginosa]|nr:DUF3486 family protein [Pseudomonas aeruginosa]